MRENVGTLDAYMRIGLGLLLFGLGLRSPSRPGSLLLLVLGAGKVAEGITRWCPVLSAMDMDTLDDDERHQLAEVTPRYGRVTRNPYRPLPDDELTPEEPPANGNSRTKLEGLRFRRRPAYRSGADAHTGSE